MLFCLLVTEVVLHIMLELLWQLSNLFNHCNKQKCTKMKQLLNAVPAGLPYQFTPIADLRTNLDKWFKNLAKHRKVEVFAELQLSWKYSWSSIESKSLSREYGRLVKLLRSQDYDNLEQRVPDVTPYWNACLSKHLHVVMFRAQRRSCHCVAVINLVQKFFIESIK